MQFGEIHDVIIVGGGPAGLTAGLYCRRAVLDTVLFEKGVAGGQLAISKDVENYPGLEGITGFDLAEKMLRHTRSYGLTVVQEEVSEILPGEEVHTVRLANGQEHRATALVLAAGSSVRKLGIPGEAEYLGSGVSYCATCDGFFFKGKDVIVVGGGDTAVEEALYLARLVRRVRLVHRGDTLKASGLLQNRLKEISSIEVLWNRRVMEIRGNSKVVESVVLEHVVTGERVEMPTEGVFIFIGNYPNNKLVPSPVRMNEAGFVVTDEKCATNVPGIFAAGDLRQKFANQIVVAAADGCIAALAAAHYVENRKAVFPSP